MEVHEQFNYNLHYLCGNSQYRVDVENHIFNIVNKYNIPMYNYRTDLRLIIKYNIPYLAFQVKTEYPYI